MVIITTINKVGLEGSVEYKIESDGTIILRVLPNVVKVSAKGNDIIGNAFWIKLVSDDKKHVYSLNMIVIKKTAKKTNDNDIEM